MSSFFRAAVVGHVGSVSKLFTDAITPRSSRVLSGELTQCTPPRWVANDNAQRKLH